MEFTYSLNVAFPLVGLLFSVFYGWKSIDIFLEVPTTHKPWAWKFHQFWLNFSGSLVGWVALWFLTRKVLSCIRTSCSAPVNFWDVATFFLAFIGITGFLPFTIVSLIQGIKELAAKIAGLGK